MGLVISMTNARDRVTWPLSPSPSRVLAAQALDVNEKWSRKIVMKDDQSVHGSYSCVEVGSSTLCQWQHDDFIATGCNSTTSALKKQYARKRDLKLCRRETRYLFKLPLVQRQGHCQMSRQRGRFKNTSALLIFKKVIKAIYILSQN
jgi:hypothetical protein